MSIIYGSVISKTGITEPARPDIENGQIDYAAELLMEFDSFGLVDSFDFNFKKIRTINEDSESTSPGDSTIRESQLSESFYTKFINNIYETGITPYKISVYAGGIPVDYILGWAHGDIERPEFRSEVDNSSISRGANYSVSYSSEEMESIKSKYDKGVFANSFSSFIATASKNVHNRMAINVSQGLEFQKNKIGKIGSKKGGPVDTSRQNLTGPNINSTANISSGGY